MYKDNKLSFHFNISTGYEYMHVDIFLDVEGDKMSGYWQIEDGISGSINMDREKNEAFFLRAINY